jgi:hypothetical protein
MADQPLNIVTWSIHSTNPELVEPLRAKLAEVVDPEIGMNIIQLGLVRNIEIYNNVARLKMILTTPFCPYGPSLMESTRQKAEATLGLPTSLAYGEEAWDFSLMEDGLANEWGLF